MVITLLNQHGHKNRIELLEDWIAAAAVVLGCLLSFLKNWIMND